MLSILDKNRTSDTVPGEAVRDPSGILMIDCRGCSQQPDVCDIQCLTCITGAVHRTGGADRIRMSAEKDYEISGKASDAVCLLSDVLHKPVCDPRSPECGGCERRPTAVHSALWATFPEPSFASARQLVRRNPTDGPVCTSCLQRTASMIDASEAQINRVRTCLGGDLR